MDVAAGEVGGQALRLGLVDQVVINVVPVVFGEGRPFFGSAAGEVTFANPSLVAQGDRVTHLLYDVPAVRRGGVMEYAAYARKLDVPAGSVPERLVFENVEARAIVPLVGLLVLQGTALYTTFDKARSATKRTLMPLSARLASDHAASRAVMPIFESQGTNSSTHLGHGSACRRLLADTSYCCIEHYVQWYLQYR